jgi:PAS domain-containing protein
MGERAKEGSGIGTKRATWTVRIQLSRVLPVLALVLAVGAVRRAALDGPMILSAAGAALLLAIDMLLRPAAAVISAALDSEPLKELLDSAGPMVMAVGLDGRFTYLNPAAERMLCYNAAELKNLAHAGEILAPGQAERLVQEMLRLRAGAKASPVSADELLAAFMESVSSLPPSQVPSFEAQLCRKDGVIIPVTLHISAVRDGSGALTGLVAMALDQSAVLKQEQAVRESQERYRDLFENSSEMIATLSPGGQFLYANPAWKRCFGLDNVPPRAGWRGGGPRAAAQPYGRRARFGIGTDPEPAAKGRQSAGGALPAARRDPTEAARAPPGPAIGRKPDRRRKCFSRIGGDADS